MTGTAARWHHRLLPGLGCCALLVRLGAGAVHAASLTVLARCHPWVDPAGQCGVGLQRYRHSAFLVVDVVLVREGFRGRTFGGRPRQWRGNSDWVRGLQEPLPCGLGGAAESLECRLVPVGNGRHWQVIGAAAELIEAKAGAPDPLPC